MCIRDRTKTIPECDTEAKKKELMTLKENMHEGDQLLQGEAPEEKGGGEPEGHGRFEVRQRGQPRAHAGPVAGAADHVGGRSAAHGSRPEGAVGAGLVEIVRAGGMSSSSREQLQSSARLASLIAQGIVPADVLEQGS
eukprot:4189450-Pyramimonas_sp.AAC.1